MTLSDFCAQQGKTADQIVVIAASEAPEPVRGTALLLGSTGAYVAGPTTFAVLLTVGANPDVPTI